MASGQLSPFPSCASGLGFMTAPDYRSGSSSLLTPTASACTISSLAQSADGESSSHSRSRTKTMQTKEILKSPQPHRFHLVLSSGRRRTPELPSMPSRPSAQWRDRLGTQASPGCSQGGEYMQARHEGQDQYSPAASPLMPAADIYDRQTQYPSYSPRSPGTEDYPVESGPSENEAHDTRSPDILEVEYPAFAGSSRPVSTASASFTLIQDGTSKRLSSASGPLFKDMFSHEYQKAAVSHERPHDSGFPLGDNVPKEDEVENDDDAETPAEVCALPPTSLFPSQQSFGDMTLEAETVQSIYSGDIASQANTSHTTSVIFDSPLPAYQSASTLPDYGDDGLPPSESDPVETPQPTDVPIQPPEHASPTKPTSARDRRKFALRRQAIYAEYGFQIALPDSDSDSSVKLLASSPAKGGHRKGGAQLRAASAYVLSPSGGSRSALSSSSSGESRLRASVGDAGDEDGMVLFGSANEVDRLGRLSVQEDIMAATRNPLLEDRADLMTSTPPRPTKPASGSVGKRSHLAHRSLATLPVPVSGLGFDTVNSGSGSRAHLTVPANSVWHAVSGAGSVNGKGSGAPWAALRIRKGQGPPQRYRGSMCIPVSTSEKSARLSAWEVDHGHHPILQDLIDEVDRALEQWTWLAQLRAYRYV